MDRTRTRARDSGATVVTEPWEVPGLGRMAVITDPEGNRMGVIGPESPRRA